MEIRMDGCCPWTATRQSYAPVTMPASSPLAKILVRVWKQPAVASATNRKVAAAAPRWNVRVSWSLHLDVRLVDDGLPFGELGALERTERSGLHLLGRRDVLAEIL